MRKRSKVSNKKSGKNRDSGLSLLELIVALGILSIMFFGFITISVSSNNDANEILRAVELFEMDLHYARMKAIRTGVNHRIRVERDVSFYYLEYRINPNRWRTIRTIEFYGNTFLYNYSNNFVSFTPRGTGTATAFYFANDSYRFRMTTIAGTGTINRRNLIRN